MLSMVHRRRYNEYNGLNTVIAWKQGMTDYFFFLFFSFYRSTFMFRAFRKWIRTRRQNQVEEDQEASSTETGIGTENFGAEAASTASLVLLSPVYDIWHLTAP